MSIDTDRPPETAVAPEDTSSATPRASVPNAPVPSEVGGRGGLDPTRYGDWEKNGRCIDF